MLTIPLLVPERVIQWAASKGYIEFEYEGATRGQDTGQCDSAHVHELEAEMVDVIVQPQQRSRHHHPMQTHSLDACPVHGEGMSQELRDMTCTAGLHMMMLDVSRVSCATSSCDDSRDVGSRSHEPARCLFYSSVQLVCMRS